MIIHQCEQRSPEWYELRRGTPTASGFARIVSGKEVTYWATADGIEYPTKVAAKEAGLTTAQIKALVKTAPRFQSHLSSSAEEYALELLASEYIENPEPEFDGAWMARGRELEDEARKLFTFETGVDIEPVGLVVDEDVQIACSPDGFNAASLVDRHPDHVGLELKCPALKTHLRYLLAGTCPEEYYPQVQGSMYVTGASHWWFMSYHPDFERFLLKVPADPGWQDAFASLLPEFHRMLGETRQKIFNRS